MGARQDGLGPADDGRRHVDDDKVKILLGHVKKPVDVFTLHDVQRQHIGRRGKDVQLVVEGLHRLDEAFAVGADGILEDFEHRISARQIKIGGDRTELEVQIQKADARRVFLADIRQFPGEVAGERGRPNPSCHAVNGQYDRVAVTSGLKTGLAGLFVVLANLRCYVGRRFRLAGAFDRLVQRTFGQGVRYEVIGPQPQQLMQRNGADVMRDQDDFDALRLCRGDNSGDPVQIGCVLGIHRDRNEFQRRTFGLVEKNQGILEREVAPFLAKLDLHIIDEDLKILHIARDCAGDNRRGFRMKICSTRHLNSPFFSESPHLRGVRPFACHRRNGTIEHYVLHAVVPVAVNLGDNGGEIGAKKPSFLDFSRYR